MGKIVAIGGGHIGGLGQPIETTEIAKEIRTQCSGLYSGKITDAQFEEGTKELLLECGGTGFILQGIGLALHRISAAYGSDFEQRVWRLADQVDSRIRSLYDN